MYSKEVTIFRTQNENIEEHNINFQNDVIMRTKFYMNKTWSEDVSFALITSIESRKDDMHRAGKRKL